MISVDIVKDW